MPIRIAIMELREKVIMRLCPIIHLNTLVKFQRCVHRIGRLRIGVRHWRQFFCAGNSLAGNRRHASIGYILVHHKRSLTGCHPVQQTAMELPITSILEWQAMTVLFSKIGATSVWAPLHCRLGIIARSARTGRLPSAPLHSAPFRCPFPRCTGQMETCTSGLAIIGNQ